MSEICVTCKLCNVLLNGKEQFLGHHLISHELGIEEAGRAWILASQGMSSYSENGVKIWFYVWYVSARSELHTTNCATIVTRELRKAFRLQPGRDMWPSESKPSIVQSQQSVLMITCWNVHAYPPFSCQGLPPPFNCRSSHDLKSGLFLCRHWPV
jgi:hypothetical protein